MKTKKAFAVLLSAVLAAGCLTSCRSKNKNVDEDLSSAEENNVIVDEKPTINIYTVENSGGLTSPEMLEDIAAKFEEEQGIHVSVQVTSSAEMIEPLLSSQDSSVDIFTMTGWSDDEWSQFAEPYCTLEKGRELYGDYADEMFGDGTNIFALMPAKAYDDGVIYNEATLKLVGYDSVPETQGEFEQLCRELRAKKIDPILLRRDDKWTLSSINTFANYVSGTNNAYPAMLKNDTPFSAGEPIGKTIRIYAAWKQMDFYETNSYSDHDSALSSIGSGKTAMMLSGKWVIPKIQQSMTANTEAIKFAPFPDMGAGRFVMTEPVGGFAISKGSQNKDDARKFIEYVSENAQYIADCGFIANKSGVTPIVPEVYKLVEEEVASGRCEVLFRYKNDPNYTHNEEVLSRADLLAGVKYAGDLLDCVDIGADADWSAFDDLVNEQNEAYAKAKADLGYSWQEKAQADDEV